MNQSERETCETYLIRDQRESCCQIQGLVVVVSFSQRIETEASPGKLCGLSAGIWVRQQV